MNRLTRSALAIGVGFVGATAIFQAAGPESDDENGPTVAGQVNVFTYCREIYGTGASALLVGGNAFSWRCSSRPNGIFLLTEINFDEACALKYDGSASNNWDESDPYAWECLTP